MQISISKQVEMVEQLKSKSAKSILVDLFGKERLIAMRLNKSQGEKIVSDFRKALTDPCLNSECCHKRSIDESNRKLNEFITSVFGS